MIYNDRDLDWTKSETRFGIASNASIYGYVLDRCDGMADASRAQERRNSAA